MKMYDNNNDVAEQFYLFFLAASDVLLYKLENWKKKIRNTKKLTNKLFERDLRSQHEMSNTNANAKSNIKLVKMNGQTDGRTQHKANEC